MSASKELVASFQATLLRLANIAKDHKWYCTLAHLKNADEAVKWEGSELNRSIQSQKETGIHVKEDKED